MPGSRRHGVTVADTRKLLLALKGVKPGTSYGMPAFMLHEKFFARFRDDDTVLVLQLGSIDDRDVLMQMDPKAYLLHGSLQELPRRAHSPRRHHRCPSRRDPAGRLGGSLDEARPQAEASAQSLERTFDSVGAQGDKPHLRCPARDCVDVAGECGFSLQCRSSIRPQPPTVLRSA